MELQQEQSRDLGELRDKFRVVERRERDLALRATAEQEEALLQADRSRLENEHLRTLVQELRGEGERLREREKEQSLSGRQREEEFERRIRSLQSQLETQREQWLSEVSLLRSLHEQKVLEATPGPQSLESQNRKQPLGQEEKQSLLERGGRQSQKIAQLERELGEARDQILFFSKRMKERCSEEQSPSHLRSLLDQQTLEVELLRKQVDLHREQLLEKTRVQLQNEELEQLNSKLSLVLQEVRAEADLLRIENSKLSSKTELSRAPNPAQSPDSLPHPLLLRELRDYNESISQ